MKYKFMYSTVYSNLDNIDPGWNSVDVVDYEHLEDLAQALAEECFMDEMTSPWSITAVRLEDADSDEWLPVVKWRCITTVRAVR